MALDPVTGALDLATTVVNKIWPDKSDQEKAQLAGALAIVQGQIDINKQEAASTNWWVAGWRPYIGWICGTGLAYQFLFYPLFHGIVQGMIPLDMGTLVTLLLGMLGLGGMRTFEKQQGVEGNR